MVKAAKCEIHTAEKGVRGGGQEMTVRAQLMLRREMALPLIMTERVRDGEGGEQQ